MSSATEQTSRNRREREENIKYIFSFISRVNFSSCTFRIFIATLQAVSASIAPTRLSMMMMMMTMSESVMHGVLFKFVAELFVVYVCVRRSQLFPFTSPFHSVLYHFSYACTQRVYGRWGGIHCFLWSDLLAAYKVTSCQLKWKWSNINQP